MKSLFKLIYPTQIKALISLSIVELIRAFILIAISYSFSQVIVNMSIDLSLPILLILIVITNNFKIKKFIALSLNIQQNLRNCLHGYLLINDINYKNNSSFLIHNSSLNSGEILTLIFDSVNSLDDFFVKVLPNILSLAILIPLILIVSLIADPISSLIFLLTLPIVPFILYLIGNTLSEKNQLALKALDKLNSDFKELLAAITTLKIFKQSQTALSKLTSTSTKSADTTLDVLKLAFISAFVLELITTLSIALIAVTIGLRLIEGSINFDVALFILFLAPEFYSPIRKLGISFHSFIKARDAIKLIRNYELGIRNDNFILNSEILIPKDELIVITGQSGSGKSTLLKNLVSNLEDCCYLPQNPHLFKASIRDNLTLFKKVDESILIKTLNEVELDFKLDDVILSMSRGQLQRLGLARVLIQSGINSNSSFLIPNSSLTIPLLVLDEPTAALDVRTRQVIINLILKYSNHCRIIVATHDPIIISKAQQLINLDDITQS